MKKIAKMTGTLLIAAMLFWLGGVLTDRQHLSEDLIRLHVVGASDEEEDQRIKLQVRDAIVAYLQDDMQAIRNTQEAKRYLQGKLSDLEQIANSVLNSAGVSDKATVTLGKENFPTRNYDTFSLPAGVYESLRVNIGNAAGRNWWCVVFPSLCLPATTEGFADTAAGAGFSDTLTDTLQQEDGYEFRFFFLDCLGWLQNLFSAA